MSVPHALLALLSEGPKYGLQLRQEFEAAPARCGRSTPGRCTRRSSASSATVSSSPTTTPTRPAEAVPAHRSRPRRARRWLRTPPESSFPPRDELVIKVLVALRVPGVDVARAHPGPPPPPRRADAAVHAAQGGRRATTSALAAGRRCRALPTRGGGALARRRRRPAAPAAGADQHAPRSLTPRSAGA